MFSCHFPRLTLFGRSALLVALLLAVNALLWTVAGILFGKDKNTQPILSLALLAWTLGLRHALDADHISAIDNATRGLISMGQLPVTCGLFFSLGHSTIVIVVIVAIAISTDVYNKLDGVGTVGGIVGAAVSGTFLFIVGLANSIILWRVVQYRRLVKHQEHQMAQGLLSPDEAREALDDNPKHSQTFVLRLLGPVITFVDRPWKMYPVGLLFGLGFDTASSIALLAVSAIAKNGADGKPIPHAYIVILPLLFTAGMTLIDSADSILMLYSYSGFPERSWHLFEKAALRPEEATDGLSNDATDIEASAVPQLPRTNNGLRGEDDAMNKNPVTATVTYTGSLQATAVSPSPDKVVSENARLIIVKRNMMSGLSIVLTLMSILVAFSISLITIMGLIGENCTSCREAADAEDGGGLAGRWWRGWANANEHSGFIGAGIVGSFIVVVAAWYGIRYVMRRRRAVRL
ncbi:Nickel/cobalt efflux system [Pleurotus pulmonarius]